MHETVAFLLARRLAGSRAKVILDVQGDWHEATRLYGSPLRRLLNPVNDALAPLAVRRADAVRTVSTQTTGLVGALGVEPAAVFPSYVDAEAFLERPPAPLPERPRAVFVGVLERYKAFDTLVEAWRLAAPQVPGAVLQIVGEGTMRDRAERLVAELPAQTEWSTRLERRGGRGGDGRRVARLPAVALGRAAARRARGRVPRPRDRRRQPRRHPGRRRGRRNGLLVDPDDAEALADALVRILSDRGLAERLGAAARRTGEEWGVTPAQYGAKVLALVHGVLEG